ncbi:histidine kinase [Intrasporangium chromatireducens Q5-1]|uniref:histidine kinase n=1 Tax=Intrasporangium chromatireducens Q5-1 TaxID=584657 RepID=W9GLC2_9MICO|nr:HAMP domain-containing sensor histidine kinase [Intrasporangium chromatireducens]EWT05613.1 histidine kinase [Intrasporangium chromatireducens Q5-1]
MTTRGHWFGSLGWRLLAAFLTVAVGAVAVLTLVAVVSVDRRTSALADEQRAALTSQIAAALAAAYVNGRGSWRPNDLVATQSLAAAHDAHVTVRDSTGHEVTTLEAGHHDGSSGSVTPAPPATSPGPSPTPTTTTPPTPGEPHHDESMPSVPQSRQPRDAARDPDAGLLATAPIAPVAATATNRPPQSASSGAASANMTPSPRTSSPPTPPPSPPAHEQPTVVTVPIVVNGTQVGTADLTLPAGADSTVTAARDALLRTVGLGAVAAVLLAAAAAAFVARRMSLPLTALASATRSFARGDPNPERLLRPAPGELGEVARSFTAMAATVRRQDELRRAVVADVAHELRTPVTILRGQTEQLLDGVAAPTTARLVSLHDEVLRLERLTDDLATLSAADAAGLDLHTDRVDLATLTRGVVTSMDATFEGASLHVDVAAGHPVFVDADATRLTQVITNLLTNAAKFTPVGGAVTVTVARKDADALLVVADTGPGIPADELPHLFERFWRGRAAGPRAGSGIGLAIVHALVTAHGGTVTAESPSGGGARFTVRLPIRTSPGQPHDPVDPLADARAPLQPPPVRR